MSTSTTGLILSPSYRISKRSHWGKKATKFMNEIWKHSVSPWKPSPAQSHEREKISSLFFLSSALFSLAPWIWTFCSFLARHLQLSVILHESLMASNEVRGMSENDSNSDKSMQESAQSFATLIIAFAPREIIFFSPWLRVCVRICVGEQERFFLISEKKAISAQKFLFQWREIANYFVFLTMQMRKIHKSAKLLLSQQCSI